MISNSKHTVVELGVWTLVTNKSPPFFYTWLSGLRGLFGYLFVVLCNVFAAPRAGRSHLNKEKKEGTAASHFYAHQIIYFVKFVKEVYSLGPFYFFLEIVTGIWDMVDGPLQLYFSAHILSAISHCLMTRECKSSVILQALACRIILSFFSGCLRAIGFESEIILRERVQHHFLQKAMHTALNLDLLKSEDPEIRNQLEGSGQGLIIYRSGAWDAFSGLKTTIFRSLAILSELSVMFKLSRTSSTFALSTAFCFVDPVMDAVKWSIFSQSVVAFCNNPFFARMASLHSFAFDDKFREDRLCNNMGCYIEREFNNSKLALGDVNTEFVFTQYVNKRSLYSTVLSHLSSNLSLMFFSLRILWDHSTVNLEELILAQQASSTVQSSSYSLVRSLQGISEHLRTIRNIYSLGGVQNKIKDGKLAYPGSSEKGCCGAEVEFRNISFKYPGTSKDALTDLSFVIKPGQLIVIVGVNGSGKSSATKLLARLYDPSAGEILLDGLPISEYKLADVRRAMAILRQDHPVLPVSFRENIALGLPDRTTADDEVDAAVHLGGADKFMQKLKHGGETILNPVKTVRAHFKGVPDAALKEIVDEKETTTNLSGGETQRLSASRTFLRLMGGNIRLLVADEPTSALDPSGEYELFSRLREYRHGKTVIFITHRFGHLTKYADLILCLKDGRLVEQGTHEKLLKMDGEYKRLFDIQAKAFVSSG